MAYKLSFSPSAIQISLYKVSFRLLDFCSCHISCTKINITVFSWFSPWCFCEERGAKCVCLLMMVSRWCLKVRAATKLLGNCCVCVPSLDSLWLLDISTKFRESLHNIWLLPGPSPFWKHILAFSHWRITLC